MISSKLLGFSRLARQTVSASVKFDVCRLTRSISYQTDLSDVYKVPVQYGVPRQVWVESLETGEDNDIMELHPDVFSVYPRIDIIHQNVVWQSKYNVVNYTHTKSVKEMIYTYGGGAKPWRQKGTGRARQGSRRAPQWINGAKVHGPRGPKPLYFMLGYHLRVYGLTHTLSVKFVQDDLHVVRDLELSSSDPDHLLSLAKSRGWSSSVLFVDTEDEFPERITAATEEIPHMNLMPVYGLNVSSMIKHQTLVLTERAVKKMTERLLFALNRTDQMERNAFNSHGPTEVKLKMEKHRPVV